MKPKNLLTKPGDSAPQTPHSANATASSATSGGCRTPDIAPSWGAASTRWSRPSPRSRRPARSASDGGARTPGCRTRAAPRTADLRLRQRVGAGLDLGQVQPLEAPVHLRHRAAAQDDRRTSPRLLEGARAVVGAARSPAQVVWRVRVDRVVHLGPEPQVRDLVVLGQEASHRGEPAVGPAARDRAHALPGGLHVQHHARLHGRRVLEAEAEPVEVGLARFIFTKNPYTAGCLPD